MENKNRPRSYIIYALTAAALLFTVMAKPDKTELDTTQAKLNQTIKETKDINNEQYQNQTTKKVINLPKSKQKVATNLTKAISDIYGNASTKELKEEFKKLQEVLGKDFLEKTMGKPQQLYTKNDSTIVSFGDTSNLSEVPITINTTYTYKNSVGKKLHTNKMFMINYNFKKTRVTNENEVELKPVGSDE
ncbi:hypothetical protein [Lactobacillus sp. ESL0681]|uniref:hypothetical protein n=1 Tax=Lactobacillus sp. ESL0681 TaxID=2983211 RepID=UPI0023F72DA8|nr:hypothetical protein [Lactobacillus sp. ESL0681]WEV41275.1 hypothetical protein OZX59_09415 [Lactobacillus sp. ESL0681]